MDYKLIRSRRRTMSLSVKDGQVIVHAPTRAPQKAIDAFVASHEEWILKMLACEERVIEAAKCAGKLFEEDKKELIKQAKDYIPKRVEYYAKIIGVSYDRISIRCQRSRWGSCSATGTLNFNCLLMLTPPEVIDSVVVHELCHRKEMNHSSDFYSEVYRAFPEYDKWNKWLKINGEVLLERAR